jgi:tRNA pseudouridine13 synthase
MKIKCQPSDFRVTERAFYDLQPGIFAFYRLTKKSIGTPEAVDRILSRWNLARDQVSYGGLKDRHAWTCQYLTIVRGPQRGMEDQQMVLEYLGQGRDPFTPHGIDCNEFDIVVRDLSIEDRDRLLASARRLSRSGWPNYFDDQRFGSLGYSNQFVAQPWCKGEWERAVWLAIADFNSHDRPEDRENKTLVQQHWGSWIELKQLLPRSNLRSIITYLCDHPINFRGTIARMRVDMRGLYLSAYQSSLWNRWLSELWRQWIPSHQQSTRNSRCGPLIYPTDLDDAQRQEAQRRIIPLPSARIKLDFDAPENQVLQSILEGEGLELRELRVKYPRDSFFSKGERQAMVFPRELSTESFPDDLYPQREALRITFALPRGAYATTGLRMLDLLGTDSHDSVDDEEFAADDRPIEAEEPSRAMPESDEDES